MRARSIKPSFWKNEELSSCSAHARLLFIGLWGISDREGRLEDRPRRIRAEIFPFEHKLSAEKLLNELERGGFIRRYLSGGAPFIQIVAFLKHQSPFHREPASIIPPEHHTIIEEPCKNTDKAVPEPYPVALTPDSGLLTPDSGLRAARARDYSENPKPIGTQLAQDAELTRAIILYDQPARDLLLALTYDPVSDKPWPHHRRMKALSEFQRFEPEVVNTASEIYRKEGHQKGYRWLLAICYGGATEEVMKRRQLKGKADKRATKAQAKRDADKRLREEVEDSVERQKALDAIQKLNKSWEKNSTEAMAK